MARDQVFISYSRKDKDWLNRLQTMLAPLTRAGFKIWADTDIKPGEEWKKVIEQALTRTKVAVLLVSPDFLDSRFIHENELPPLLDAAKNKELTILWVPVRHSLYKETIIAHFQAACDPTRPLSTLSPTQQDAELVRIAETLIAAIHPLSVPSPPPPEPPNPPSPPEPPNPPSPPEPPNPPSPPSLTALFQRVWRQLLIVLVLGVLGSADVYYLGKASPLPPIENIHGWSAQQVQDLQKQTAQALKQDVEFHDPLKYGYQGPLMVVIPGGRFQMGSPDTEPGRSQDERQHKVEVQAFAIGKYEVTVEQFKRFAEMTGYKTEAEKSGGCYYWTGSEWKQDADKNWRNPGFSETDNHPVVCISWNDAMEYVRWLKEQTGKPYHLPTEAEWEYAVRAGQTTPFYFGDTISTDKANYNGNYTYGNGHKGFYRQKTVEVGLFQANAWGLHDMHGNVYEWTCSVYDEQYNGSEQQPCPELTIWIPHGVLRGGSWFDNPVELRGAARYSYLPQHPGSTNFGFRLARTFP